jgi:hypothetical protein
LSRRSAQCKRRHAAGAPLHESLFVLTVLHGSKPATGNPGKICWRITLWYRVIGGIATELAIAYSLHTAGRLCRSRKPIGAGTITLVAAGEWQPHLRTTFKRCTDRNTSTSFSGPLREVLAEDYIHPQQELLFLFSS